MNSRNTYKTRNDILEQVKQIVLHHLADQTAQTYLCGSWARCEEKRSWDIDIAIEFEQNPNESSPSTGRVNDSLSN